MTRYKVGEDTYTIPSDKVEEFLIEFPDAVLLEDTEESTIQEDIIETPQETTEIVEKKPVELPEVETPEIKDVKVEQEKVEEDKIGDFWEEFIFTPKGMYDFYTDLVREAKSGVARADIINPSFDLMFPDSDSETRSKEILNFIETQKDVSAKNMVSAEMKAHNKIAAEAGGGFWGFLKGVQAYPSTLFTTFVNSIALQGAALLKSDEVAAGGLVGAGAGAAAGAKLGSMGGPAGGLFGTGSGSLAGLFTGGMITLEAGTTFAELLQEEVGGELTEDNVRAVLEDSEKLTNLKNRSWKRGVTIGLIELLTMAAAKGVGSKIAKSGFTKSGTPSPGLGLAAAGTIEVAGGGAGEISGRYVADQEMDWNDIGFEMFSGLSTAPITMGSQIANIGTNLDRIRVNNTLKDTQYNNISEAFSPESPLTNSEIQIAKLKNSTTILDEQVNERVNKAEITKDEGNKIRLNFRETQGALNQVKALGFNLDQETEAINLLKEKKRLVQKIDEVGDVNLTMKEKARVDEINLELQEVSTEGIRKGIKQVEGAIELAGLEDISIKSFKDTKAIDTYLEDTGKDATVKYSGDQGIVIQYESGNQEIIINEDVAAKDQAVSVAGHEFLHALLRKTLADTPDAGKRLGDALFKEISQIDMAKVIDSKLLKRINQYNAAPENVQGEEVLTLFSDAIATGDIKFNENIFTKIGDTVRSVLQSMGVKVKFNNGKDVYNFIKDYNKSLAKSELTKAQQEVATEGATGKLITPTQITKETIVKKSKAEQKRSNESIANENAKINQEILDADVKNTDGEVIADESARAKLMENNLSKVQQLAQKAANNPNIANLEAGKRKTYEDFFGEYYLELDALTRTYRPDNTKGDFGAYMMQNLERRYGAVLSKLKKGEIDQTTSIDSETARQVVDTSDTTGDVDTKTTPKIEKVSKKVLSKQLEFDKVDKAIAKLLKDPNFKIPTTYKSSAQITPKLIAELFGVNPEQYVDAKKSLTKADVIAARTFIAKNPAELYAALPAPATEQGKSTGISPKLLTAIYGAAEGRVDAKLGKSTQGLKAREKMEKPPFNQKAFIKIFTPDKIMKVENQTAESGMIKALMKEIEKAMVNQAIRLNPDSKLTQQAEQKYKEGISRTLASKGETVDITKKENQKLIEEQDINNKKQQAQDEGVSIEEVNENDKLENSNYKNLVVEVAKKFGFKDLKYTQPSKVLSKRIEDNIKSIINFFPKNLTKDPSLSYLLSAVKETVGMGKRIELDGKRITISKFIELSKDQGTGKPKPWMKNVYQPSNWGYNGGFKSKIENWLLDNKKLPGWEGRFSLYAANLLTKPSLRSKNKIENFEGYNTTIKSNREAIKFFYNSLAQKFAKDPTVETLEDIIYSLQIQTNHIKSIIKGFVPVTSVTSKPKGIVTKKGKDIKTHNEHMVELFNANYQFLKILGDNKGNLKSKKFNFELNDLVDNLQQSLIPKTSQIAKDKTGASTSTSPNAFINTFVKRGDTNNQIMLTDLPGKTLNMFILSKYFPNTYKQIALASKKTAKKNKEKFGIKLSKSTSTEQQIGTLYNYDQAASKARSLKTPEKGISVFDFDDTIAKTKSKVLYTLPNGKKGKLSPEEFATKSALLEEQRATFDFSEFNKVIKGKKGPLADLALKRQGKFGGKDIFILTARPQQSAPAIHEFLKGIGLDIPLNNITGLEDGTPQAKANWVASKAAEGYNNFYFADDQIKNVKAVKEILDQVDVKSKVQQAKASKAETLNKEFNIIIEKKTGLGRDKQYSPARAKTVGANKGKWNFWIPYSAEDFVGLMYPILSKGKEGDTQMAWLKKNLLDPFNRAENAITQDKIAASNDFNALKKQFTTIPKTLKKEAVDGFTYENALRVYLWDQQGETIPGLAKKDIKELTDFINKDTELKVFADELIKIQKGKPYPAPTDTWLAGSLTTDVIGGINTANRTEYLQEWQENVDIIFSKENMNKLEATYGSRYVEALRNILTRMKKGSNKTDTGNRVVNNILDWVNNSVGAIMFLNTRSAVLQTISSINFINWSDNNVLKAGKAFANQPQYWKDFMKLFNSDFLVARRKGLKINVTESEIADAAESGSVKGVVSMLLKKGFVFTQIADSFAIASGGATFYRNRLNKLVKDGMSKAEAEKQAFLDFYDVAEESQQSSRTDRISMQQASAAGRVILAFGNTPMQYGRLMKKAFLDLKNGRGDAKSNVSKIVYYAVIQNIIFNAIQNALFVMMFDDDDDIPQDKAVRTANGMMDSILRGLGIGGAAVSTAKNIALKIAQESGKKSPKYEDAAWEMLDFSPPISSKVSKLRSAGRTVSWNQKEINEKGFSLDNPAYLAGAQVVSATTNIPLDRVIKKGNNIADAVSEESEIWQKIALLSGWSMWELQTKKPEIKMGFGKRKKIDRKKIKRKVIKRQ